METQTRFDLNAAVASWQQELASQPDLTPIVRRELETHLRDTLAELQARGLNNEESFWLARRRAGRPRQLNEEFAKADPTKVWRERIFWMVAALLVVNLWAMFCNQFYTPSPRFMKRGFEDILPGWILFYLPFWLRHFNPLQIFLRFAGFVPVLLAVFLANGRLKLEHPALAFILASRKRFVLTMLCVFLVANWAVFFVHDPSQIMGVLLIECPWVFSLIALAAWLIPAKKRTVARTA